MLENAQKELKKKMNKRREKKLNVSPKWSDLILATYIPHGEVYVLIFHSSCAVSNKRFDRTHSTLKPIVGIVVTISPSLSLYKIVVLPAASRPTYENSK